MAKLKVSCASQCQLSSALSTSIRPVLNIVYIMVHRCHNWRSVPCSQHYFHHISPRGAECGGWRQQQQIYNSQLTTTRNKNKYFAAAATPEIEMEAEQELGLELRWLIGKVWKFLNPLVLAYERWPASPRLISPPTSCPQFWIKHLPVGFGRRYIQCRAVNCQLREISLRPSLNSC